MFVSRKKKSKTQVFKSYSDFLKRKDKTVNGVSEAHARRYPNYAIYNATNEGCWNCIRCMCCKNCKYCRYCRYCEDCICATELYRCTNCFLSHTISHSRSCGFVTDSKNIKGIKNFNYIDIIKTKNFIDVVIEDLLIRHGGFVSAVYEGGVIESILRVSKNQPKFLLNPEFKLLGAMAIALRNGVLEELLYLSKEDVEEYVKNKTPIKPKLKNVWMTRLKELF